MSRVIAALRAHAANAPHDIAIESADRKLSYPELLDRVHRTAKQLESIAPKVIGILADNGIGWVVADLAALMANIPIVPIPSYFSDRQLVHLLRSASIDCMFTDQIERLAHLDVKATPVPISFCEPLQLERFSLDTFDAPILPTGTWKITFTSGTTGDPKGVCLGIDDLETTAQSVCLASQAAAHDRHLCLLPLATLLENVGGVYAAIIAGATICAWPLAQVGLSGSSTLNVAQLITAINTSRATSVIAIPQMLQALVAAGHAGSPMPANLRYLAIGGAPVSVITLKAAATLGLPVFEGYGLSECASVVTVNRPNANRRGSVGKPLAHVHIDIADDGEIYVRGIARRSYLGDPIEPHTASTSFATGDLGHFDTDGYLYLSGRKKNIFITSFGRNVAPEWLESELTSQTPILQAAIFGEARPFNTAVIFAQHQVADESIDQALLCVNANLPDYARVTKWIRASEPFSVSNGLATPNGRLRRNNIYARYAEQIAGHYSNDEGHQNV